MTPLRWTRRARILACTLITPTVFLGLTVLLGLMERYLGPAPS